MVTATVAEARTEVVVMHIFDAAVMPTATQSAANGGPVGDDDSTEVAMQ